ncbi:uncharacterized protein K489DRAFT_230300 [Dissoconium aciculare CBS 342.82]|uniref:Uncharacterized protein n=1 Tax=Dissoconium aciculare CBS 342.82 TaxID=1314786 RepID=A0A6J3M1W5_9PEZI|nr:uncharacterized protein K489DRAFT_230300 [Dissoconium aciculare CBS 342.82]KAF1822010.1 hypothetical protein K489DRAFT_230300 [Dissoconium aciculare CBS 342.82]
MIERVAAMPIWKWKGLLRACSFHASSLSHVCVYLQCNQANGLKSRFFLCVDHDPDVRVIIHVDSKHWCRSRAFPVGYD